jgi:hypothetical protein
MIAQHGDLECCARCAGPVAAERLARRAALRAAVHPPPVRPGPGRPGRAARDGTVQPGTVQDGTVQDGTVQDGPGQPGTVEHRTGQLGTGPLPVLTGTVLDASPQILILKNAGGEHRLVLPPATEVWRGRRAEPTALEPGDSVLVRLLAGQRNVADRIWANAGRVTGVIVSREAGRVLVDEGRTAPREAVLIPGGVAARLQVRFPRMEPGYLIDVIGLRHPGYLEAVLPATSQPAYRAGDPAAVAPAGRPLGQGPISGSATWHEPASPDDAPGVRYPALDPGTPCREQPLRGHACPPLPYLSVGSLLGIRNECTGRAQVLPVSGCAPAARLLNDRCVTCGTSPRGRIAELPMAIFVALGGELERGCFNATISVGSAPGGEA